LHDVQRPACRIEGCGRPVRRSGHCGPHYDRLKRYGSATAGGVFRDERPLACTVDGCASKVLARGWCVKHYNRWANHGDPLKAKWEIVRGRRHEWHAHSEGYVWRYVGREDPHASANGFAFQHRVVMAELIGRPLTPSESAHHINGDRADNRPENLELWVKSQPAGQRASDLVQWARQIIRDYGHLLPE